MLMALQKVATLAFCMRTITVNCKTPSAFISRRGFFVPVHCHGEGRIPVGVQGLGIACRKEMVWPTAAYADSPRLGKQLPQPLQIVWHRRGAILG
jgi:hypothetical protein